MATPAAAGVLAAALLLDFWFLPYGSQAGEVRQALGLLGRPRISWPSDLWQVHQEADALRVVHQIDAEGRTDTREAIAALFWYGRVTGFWAPTQHRRTVRFEFHPAGAVNAHDREQVRRLVIEDYLRRWPQLAPEVAILRSAQLQTTSIVWTGVAHNALSATAAVLLLCS